MFLFLAHETANPMLIRVHRNNNNYNTTCLFVTRWLARAAMRLTGFQPTYVSNQNQTIK